MKDKQYLVTEGQLVDTYQKGYDDGEKNNKFYPRWIKKVMKHPVKFLDRAGVEKIFKEHCHKNSWNEVNPQEYHLTEDKFPTVIKQILSLAIPQPDEGKIREIVKGWFREMWYLGRENTKYGGYDIEKAVKELAALMKGDTNDES